ncbi:glycoside hydrolase 43 family protein [Pedobacter sp. MC2016-14]|uniref:glycoside hydrolase family 43 protein n=1 Tax=Pedobacter sp. MC2016-14 TaxID=2897327 RepID=UPI001E2C9B22|nr:glycoside hydrolase 43 family protein [Pedobacter sp. MC2016-14]MCD0488683.1 glycoside hydrolase 43 family protein [Pedobacter sp. MC2016-14]
MFKIISITALTVLSATLNIHAQSTIKTTGNTSKVWVADLGNGKYKNPVLDADYSDPDAIRVGDDFYMVASSFDAVPGLPILHSKDLVNWTILTHALTRQPPFEHFARTQHGNGVWAPSIRYHNNEFYIYYPDPDFGIYVIKAKDAKGPWSAPKIVEPGKGLIDPCPLWDDNGKVYLAYAYAGSRAGIKSVIAVKELNAVGDQTITSGTIVYDGHELDPTIEGPKFYKRNGYYYIFAPAGGVATGWQLVLRSKNIYGPYERKVVMDQGKSSVNGPHQGAWVTTQTGEDWFLHFQDKFVYGRVVHLQPMKWVKDWPVIGLDIDGDGIGEPVRTYKKPNVGKSWPVTTPAESDEFDGNVLGLQWQWQANPKATWAFASAATSKLRLYTEQIPDSAKNYWDVPQLLLQKFPTEVFTATTKLKFMPNPKLENEKTGLIVMGRSYASLALKSDKSGIAIVYSVCNGADKGKAEVEKTIAKLNGNEAYLRVQVSKGGVCQFSYSKDGKDFTNVAAAFEAKEGQWIGAKLGLFATRPEKINDSGYVDYDWFRIN